MIEKTKVKKDKPARKLPVQCGFQKGHPQYGKPPLGHPPYGGETGGRPKIWTDEKIEEIAEWFMTFMDDPENLYFKEFVIFMRQQKNILIKAEYLSKWAETNERFRDAYDYVKTAQECRILKGGMTKRYDSNLSKYLLSAIHGITDKQIVEHQGNDVINVIHYGQGSPKTWKDEANA